MSMAGTIKALRKAKGISQQALSRGIGIDQSTISLWEKGGSEPSRVNAQKLAKFLGISIAQLHQDASIAVTKAGTKGASVDPSLKKLYTLEITLTKSDEELVRIACNFNTSLVETVLAKVQSI